MQLKQIAQELASSLALLGLAPTKIDLYSEFRQRVTELATWRISSDRTVGAFLYSARYFGIDRIWVGFGSKDSNTVATLVREIAALPFVTIRYHEWSDDADFEVSPAKLKELGRKTYTAYEDYTDESPRLWAWFGRYFETTNSELPFDFLREVISEYRSKPQNQMQGWDGPTDAVASKKVRLQQARFKKAVLQRWNWRCAVTGVEVVPLLEAAHIKPYALDNSAFARTSPDNGILLLSTWHQLFDLGLISFSKNGLLLVSPNLAKRERDALNIRRGMKLLRPLSTKQAQFMRSHRKAHGFKIS